VVTPGRTNLVAIWACTVILIAISACGASGGQTTGTSSPTAPDATATHATATPRAGATSLPLATSLAATPAPTPEKAPPSAAPTTTPAALPTSPVRAGVEPLDPRVAKWVPLGPARLLGNLANPTFAVGGLVGFDRGYVALGEADILRPYDAGPVAWFSADGLSWSPALLAGQVPGCPDTGSSADGTTTEARMIATNGREIVIVGGATTTCSSGAIAWRSADGRTWQASAPFSNTRAYAVWPSDGGWQAESDDAVWESSDALNWTRLADLPGRLAGPGGTYTAGGVAGTSGAGVLAGLETGDGWPALFASPTGQSWRRLAGDGGCGRTYPAVLPPARLDAWVVIVDLRVCASRDLVTWSATNLDVLPFGNAQTRYGAVVMGNTCHGEYSKGEACPDGPRAWVSVDGMTWTRLANPPGHVEGPRLADGPAGVLLIAAFATDNGHGAWRLVP
jgi:hypothetical protein